MQQCISSSQTMMKCVELANTEAATELKAVKPQLQQMTAQVAFKKFAKRSEERMSGPNRRNNVGDRVATLGSDGMVYCDRDSGIFSATLAAYNNHWKLRTSPDDWWYCVTVRVALAIDENAKKECIRRMFVDHEGKKTLTVAVPTLSIYDVDYALFFQQMSEEIAKNVKVPSYVDVVTADFTTTTPATRIASQISIMASLQEFFEYGMCGCGIPAIEMLGSENDWIRLGEKLEALKKILEPILDEIGLSKEWWSHAEKVFQELLKTYQGNPDKEWWDRIIYNEGSWMSGRHTFSSPAYTGWLIEFVEGSSKGIEPHDFKSGLVTVPLKIEMGELNDTAALVAGMLGFTLYEENVPVVQPFQGWALLLPEDSPFRSKTAA